MIAPSILSSDFASLKEILSDWEKKKSISLIHFDVMDNHFVPNLTFGAQFIRSLRPYTQIPFDVHLMIENPLASLPQYIESGIQYLSLHLETLPSSFRPEDLTDFRSSVKIGLALRPQTPVTQLISYLPFLDFVLIMSVNPGFSGQSFMPVALSKIQELQDFRSQNQLTYAIEVDGGINEENMLSVMERGADILVMGSGFFHHPSPERLLLKYQQYRSQVEPLFL